MGRRRRPRRRSMPPPQSSSPPPPPLPPELMTRVMALLTWRETNAMARVCRRWRAETRVAADARAEWRSTQLLAPGEPMADALARLCSDHGGWADTSFPPELVLLTARARDPRPFARGAFWTRAVAAMERARLLPPRCLVLGALSVARAGEPESEDGNGEDGRGDSLQVTAARLPGMELQAAALERKELRRGADDPFPSASGRAAALLVLSANEQSARALLAAAGGWESTAGAAITGAVLPHNDRTRPVMLYRRMPTSMEGKSAATPEVQFPSAALLRLAGGRVRLRAWAASGLTPATPVVARHDTADAADGEELAAAAVYRRVTVGGGPVASLPALVRSRVDLSSDRPLWIAVARDVAALERLLADPTSAPAGLEMVECGYSAALDVVFSLGGRRWAPGELGVVLAAGDGGDWQRREAQQAIERVRRESAARGERPLGLLVACLGGGEALSGAAEDAALPLAAVATRLALGPDHEAPGVLPGGASGLLLSVAPALQRDR